MLTFFHLFSKLDRLTPNKTRGFLDDSTITSLESDLGSEYTTDAKSVDLSPERGRAVITNNLLVGNVVREPNVFETRSRDQSPERGQLVMAPGSSGESSKGASVSSNFRNCKGPISWLNLCLNIQSF